MNTSQILRLLNVVLRCLSPLAPRIARDRWLREWMGELAHHPSPGLLMAALRDALFLRLHRPNLSPATPGAVHPAQDRPMMDPLFADVRFSFRTLRSAPWFSLVTVLTLALGIGASVAMFGVLNAVFLEPLPFPTPQELVVGRATFEGQLNPWAAGADYYDYRDQAQSFTELAAILPFPMQMTESGRGEASRVSVNVASTNLFPALGVTPALGRTFSPHEGMAHAEDVALLSHPYWWNQMGGDPQALGSTLTLDGMPYTVVGILPRDFFFMGPADLWVPMRPDRLAASERDSHNWYLVGRMDPGVALDQAQAQVDAISLRLQEAYPETNATKGLRLTGLHEVLTEDYRTSLWFLTGAVALVLLIACGNGAGILLARAPARRFELSIRAAMGAPRGRLFRQLLLESLELALAGGVLGTVLAVWFQRIMLQYLEMDLLGLERVGISYPTLLAALGMTLFAGLLAGVYPAVKSANVSLTQGLKTGHRGVGGGGTGFRSALVVAQVALSLILLAGSGLLIRSLTKLQALDPGFRTGGLVTADFEIPGVRYPTAQDRDRFFTTLLDEVRALPSAQAATLTSHLPIGDVGNVWRANAQGREDDRQRIFLRSVYPGYFETLGIPLVAGRDVDGTDRAGGPWVVILSETAAQRLFPDENPMGKIVELSLNTGPRPMEVIGVVGDVRLSRLEEEPEAALYVPYPHRAGTEMRLAMETRVPPGTLARTLGELLQRLDPQVPVTRVATLESLISDSMAQRRIVTLSLTLLALLPLLLASVGLFSVLAYHVSRRKHEIGVRMALGADAAHVSRLVLGQGLRMVAEGVALGVAGAAAATRVLQGLLFGVEARDPLTFLAVVALVVGVAVLACVVPVWRAVRGDPRVVLEAQ